MNKDVYVVLLAAGRGERMGANKPKQVLTLAGKALALYSLETFEQVKEVKEIVLVENHDVKKDFDEMLSGRDLKKNILRVTGGATRQASVLAGLKALSQKNISHDAVVLVHDAARPLLTIRDLTNLLHELDSSRAAILATRSSDTLKQVSAEEIIEKTIDRTQIWCASTPQGARLGDLLEALERAQEKGIEITDEAQGLERIGVPVKIIEQRDENFKITTHADLHLAEAVLRERLNP